MLGNIFNLGIGRIFAFVYAKRGELPAPLLVPIVMLMAGIGAYSYENNPYDVLIMLFFGVVGLFMRTFRIPEAPLIITFLLAPQAEENLRRGLLINEGDWFATLMNSPLAIGLAIGVVLLTYISSRLRISERMIEMSEEQMAEDEKDSANRSNG